jgi:hypothetical protein
MTEQLRNKGVVFGHFGKDAAPARHRLSFEARLLFAPKVVLIQPGAAVGLVELWGDGKPYKLWRSVPRGEQWEATATHGARSFVLWVQLLTTAEATAGMHGFERYHADSHPCGHALCAERTLDGYELCPLCASSRGVTPCTHCGSL